MTVMAMRDTKMRRYGLLSVACAVVVLLLFVGYVRLPYAALRGLGDWEMLTQKPIVHGTSSQIRVSPVQAWWTKLRVRNLSEGDAAPRISVQVKWNVLLLARVHCGHYASPTGAEGRDSLYLWFFGLWIRVHDFTHVMA
jgi:hypothetical protein